jgi:hypothetical protein
MKRGGLGGLHHVPFQRRGGKTASLLMGNVSISHIEVLMLPTSPNVAKSLKPSKSVESTYGHTSDWCIRESCPRI